MKLLHQENAVEGTGRIETFSDGVIAIIMTLLILELRVPEIETLTSAGAFEALAPLAPKFLSFFISFVTLAIFWVNHHHFFHPIAKSNGTLLWLNNHLLFWLAIIPFVTALIGDYPGIPLIVALYGFVLFMSGLAFALMGKYVFFKSALLPETISLASRKTEFRRSIIGALIYGLSVVTAFLNPTISLVIFVILPLCYFIPRRIE